MITFEERWAYNKKRRKALKGDALFTFHKVCSHCKQKVNLAYGSHHCEANGYRVVDFMDLYEKVVVSYPKWGASCEDR